MAQVGSQNEPLHEFAAFGYDGSAFHRLPMLWGYTDRFMEEIVNLNAVAGTNTLTMTAVPAGYIYILQAASIMDQNTGPTRAMFFVPVGTLNIVLLDNAGMAAGKWSSWSGSIVLKEGDQLKGLLGGCALNDDLYMEVWGYKMKVND